MIEIVCSASTAQGPSHRGTNEEEEPVKRSVSSLFVVCIAAASSAVAQAPAGPPKVIMIYREEVKPARGSLHAAVEAGFAQVWSKAGAQPYLAMTAVTGSVTEALFISAYPSWEAVDKDMAAFEKGSSTPEFTALSKQEADKNCLCPDWVNWSWQ